MGYITEPTGLRPWLPNRRVLAVAEALSVEYDRLVQAILTHADGALRVKGPRRGIKIGRRVLYEKTEVERWLAEQKAGAG